MTMMMSHDDDVNNIICTTPGNLRTKERSTMNCATT